MEGQGQLHRGDDPVPQANGRLDPGAVGDVPATHRAQARGGRPGGAGRDPQRHRFRAPRNRRHGGQSRDQEAVPGARDGPGRAHEPEAHAGRPRQDGQPDFLVAHRSGVPLAAHARRRPRLERARLDEQEVVGPDFRFHFDVGPRPGQHAAVPQDCGADAPAGAHRPCAGGAARGREGVRHHGAGLPGLLPAEHRAVAVREIAERRDRRAAWRRFGPRRGVRENGQDLGRRDPP
mmetsp:Transcript_115510/g.331541  ORF Transcript_115510/g.331541 Transcript_115510/m.331541 type:complete len:234 (-) Transcript_115510:2982-3683(-)